MHDKNQREEHELPLGHPFEKAKRINFRANTESGVERKLKKKSELSPILERIPEHGIIRKDYDPSGFIDISPENQLKILQTLLSLKSQGIHVPEVVVNQVKVY